MSHPLVHLVYFVYFVYRQDSTLYFALIIRNFLLCDNADHIYDKPYLFQSCFLRIKKFVSDVSAVNICLTV